MVQNSHQKSVFQGWECDRECGGHWMCVTAVQGNGLSGGQGLQIQLHSKGRGPCVSSGDNVDNDSVKSNALADRYK